MAKLFAEIDSDKHGRKASKSGDSFLRIDVFRGNKKIGTLGVYEVLDVGKGTHDGIVFTPVDAYRVAWHPVAGQQTVLEDTEKAHVCYQEEAIDEHCPCGKKLMLVNSKEQCPKCYARYSEKTMWCEYCEEITKANSTAQDIPDSVACENHDYWHIGCMPCAKARREYQ